MAAPADGQVPNGASKPLEGKTSRQEQANAAASRPGRTKRDLKRKAPPAAAAAEQGELVRVEPVHKNHPALFSFPKVEVCKYDRAPEVELSEDRMGAVFRLGYRMARATHGVYQGTWYFEVNILHLGETGHCRLGWSTRLGEWQAPVGYDAHSYGYRDLEGSKVHRAVREAYGKPYKEGDVIGCLIHLPPGGRPFEYSKQDIVSYRSGLYFLPTGNAAPNALPGSFVTFTLNGVSQGVAYRDVMEGTYHPALSMYTLPQQTQGATATFNFGPSFKHPPPQLEGVPPAAAMCLLAKEPPAEVATAGPAAGTGTGTGAAPEAAAPSGRQSLEAQLTSTSQPSQPGSRTGSSVPAALAAITRPFTSLMGKSSGRTSPAVGSQEQRTSK